MSTSGTVLFLDHTAQLGGAELSVARYLRRDEAISSALAILSPESVAPWALPEHIGVFHTTASAGVDSVRRIVSELTAIIERVNPACVIANSYSAAQYLAFVPKRGRRYYYFLRQEAIPEGVGRAKRALNHAFVLPRFDGFFANSSWTAGTLPRQVAKSRPVVISRPISGVKIAAEPRRDDRSKPVHLLTLSLLSPWKGVDTAIAASIGLDEAIGRPVSLTVAGGDLFGEEAYSAQLRQMAEGSGVEFVGHQSDTEPLLRRSQVLLCLSKTPEPFGQVVIQGMAHGCVVIATDQGGPREIITHGTDGILVAPDAPDQVRDALVRLFADPALFASLSANAMRAARAYTDDVTIPAFSAAIESLVPDLRP